MLGKHKKTIILLFFFFSFYAQAQVASVKKTENALLWKISGKEIKKPSFLFGTIHMVPKADFFFTPPMEKAFLKSKELIMEVDMEIQPELKMQLARDIMLPDGKSLSDYLSKAVYSRYMAYLKDSLRLSPMNLFLIPKIKPMFSYSLILKEKLDKPVSYENYFQKLAKKHKIEISGLESLQEQMNIINSIPIEEQMDLITDTTLYNINILTAYKDMLTLYKEQNINKLMQAADDEKIIRRYAARLITNRNKYWVSLIEQRVLKHACFIAVGAGHLAGHDGLINLLREAGYNVQPIKIYD